jgi:hypothetical protein
VGKLATSSVGICVIDVIDGPSHSQTASDFWSSDDKGDPRMMLW